MELKTIRLKKRKLRVRGKINGTLTKPRLTVFRSNQHIYAQMIDDENGNTLVFASDNAISKGTNVEKAKQVGQEIAKLALAKKISTAVFDRNGNRYHGRIRSVAEGAREGGLKF
jgi:large subunit ribosomal protein L18